MFTVHRRSPEEQDHSIPPIQNMTERHAGLRRLARWGYQFPGVYALALRTAHGIGQCAFVPAGVKQRTRNFFAPDSPRSPITFSVASTGGRKVSFRLAVRDHPASDLFYCGYDAGYEPGTTRLFKGIVSRKACIFDIGANVGYYSMLAAAALAGRGAVYAFEPHPSVAEELAMNARLNEFKCLKLEVAAMSDCDGVVPLFLPQDAEARSNASLVPSFTAQCGSVEARAVRFDTYCSLLGIARVDLVKIDVEGGELRVLRGMGELLDEWLPDIICEVLDPYADDLDAFFAPKPYRKYLITDTGLEEVPHLKAHAEFRDYYLTAGSLPLPW